MPNCHHHWGSSPFPSQAPTTPSLPCLARIIKRTTCNSYSYSSSDKFSLSTFDMMAARRASTNVLHGLTDPHVWNPPPLCPISFLIIIIHGAFFFISSVFIHCTSNNSPLSIPAIAQLLYRATPPQSVARRSRVYMSIALYRKWRSSGRRALSSDGRPRFLGDGWASVIISCSSWAVSTVVQWAVRRRLSLTGICTSISSHLKIDRSGGGRGGLALAPSGAGEVPSLSSSPSKGGDVLN
jgi:hypothetical protein